MSSSGDRAAREAGWFRHHRPIALIATMAIMSGGVVMLRRVPVPIPARHVVDDVLLLVPLEARRELRETRIPLPDPAPALADAAHASRARETRLRRASDAAARMSRHIESASPEVSGPASAGATALDLRIPDTRASEPPRLPWERGSRAAFERPALLNVHFEEPSLRARARLRECAELRAAMRRPSASLDVIVASMRKRGCG